MSAKHLWNDNDRAKSKNWDTKNIPSILCPPEIRHGLRSNPELLMVVSVTQNV